MYLMPIFFQFPFYLDFFFLLAPFILTYLQYGSQSNHLQALQGLRSSPHQHKDPYDPWPLHWLPWRQVGHVFFEESVDDVSVEGTKHRPVVGDEAQEFTTQLAQFTLNCGESRRYL